MEKNPFLSSLVENPPRKKGATKDQSITFRCDSETKRAYEQATRGEKIDMPLALLLFTKHYLSELKSKKKIGA